MSQWEKEWALLTMLVVLHTAPDEDARRVHWVLCALGVPAGRSVWKAHKEGFFSWMCSIIFTRPFLWSKNVLSRYICHCLINEHFLWKLLGTVKFWKCLDLEAAISFCPCMWSSSHYQQTLKSRGGLCPIFCNGTCEGQSSEEQWKSLLTRS